MSDQHQIAANKPKNTENHNKQVGGQKGNRSKINKDNENKLKYDGNTEKERIHDLAKTINRLSNEFRPPSSDSSNKMRRPHQNFMVGDNRGPVRSPVGPVPFNAGSFPLLRGPGPPSEDKSKDFGFQNTRYIRSQFPR